MRSYQSGISPSGQLRIMIHYAKRGNSVNKLAKYDDKVWYV